MYNDILVPTDGSEGAEKAAEHAVELAEKFDAELHFINIVDIRAASSGDMWVNVLGQLEEAGKDAVDELEEKTDLDAHTEVLKGNPSSEIVSYAEENGVDLIVMGTQGRTGLDRILVGSTAEKVVRTSPVPVMTVRSERE